MAIQEVDDKSFEKEVLGNEGLALVDFWSPTCVPCKIVGQIMEMLVDDYQDRVEFYKVDVDRSPLTAERFNIRGVPALILLKSGVQVDRYNGPAPKSHIESMLNKHS